MALHSVITRQSRRFIYLYYGIQVAHEISVQVDFNSANYFSLGHDWDPGPVLLIYLSVILIMLLSEIFH